MIEIGSKEDPDSEGNDPSGESIENSVGKKIIVIVLTVFVFCKM